MKYYVTWKENGVEDFDECYEIDSYDNELIEIEEIEECME